MKQTLSLLVGIRPRTILIGSLLGSWKQHRRNFVCLCNFTRFFFSELEVSLNTHRLRQSLQ